MKFKSTDMGIKMESFDCLKIQVHDKSVDLEEMIKRVELFEKTLDSMILENVVHQNSNRALFTKNTVEAARAANDLKNIRSKGGFEPID